MTASALPLDTRPSLPWPRPVRRLLWLLGALALLAFAGPLVTGSEAAWKPDWEALSEPPSWQHWLGTDAIGRDVLARSLMGLRMSLLIGVCATLVALLIGVAYGAWAGLSGGRTERLMMRALDVLSALPFLLLVILLLALFERSLWLLLAAIAGQAWIDLARVLRAEASRLRESGFVLAARAAGAGRVDLLRRHVVPNLLPLAMVYAGLIAANVVLVESFLGFLGLGLVEPWAGLGALLGEGAQELDTAPWVLIGPAALLCALLLTFQRLGEALRDALDPRLVEASPVAAGNGAAHDLQADSQGEAAAAIRHGAGSGTVDALRLCTLHQRAGAAVANEARIHATPASEDEPARASSASSQGDVSAALQIGAGSGTVDALRLSTLHQRAGAAVANEARTHATPASEDEPARASSASSQGDVSAALQTGAGSGTVDALRLSTLHQRAGAALANEARTHAAPVSEDEPARASSASSQGEVSAALQTDAGSGTVDALRLSTLRHRADAAVANEARTHATPASEDESARASSASSQGEVSAALQTSAGLGTVDALRLSTLRQRADAAVANEARTHATPASEDESARASSASSQGEVSAALQTGAGSGRVDAHPQLDDATIANQARRAAAAIAVDALQTTLPDGHRIGPMTFALYRGDCLGLIGGSGSGKSLTALALTGLLPRGLRAQGVLRLGDTRIDLAAPLPAGVRGLRVGLVFQDPLASLHPLRCVGSQLRESLRQLRGLRGAELDKAARAALVEVGLGEAVPGEVEAADRSAVEPAAHGEGPAAGLSVERFLRARPGQLSGGQRQRVMIALALCGQPQLLICDEATSALDLLSQHGVLDLLERLRRERGLAVLFIGHDLDVVARLADQLCVLERGRVVEQGPTAAVLANPQAQYTQRLLAARGHDVLYAEPGDEDALLAKSDDAQDDGASVQQDPSAAETSESGHSPKPTLFAPAKAGAQPDPPQPSRAAVTADAANTPMATTSTSPSQEATALHPSAHPPFAASALLRLRGFGLHYAGAPTAAVHGVDLEIAHGECLAVLGASGSGKSSLVRGLLRLADARIEGEAWLQDAPLHSLQGRRLRALRPRAQIVFQDPYSSLDPRQRIDALLAEPLQLHGRPAARERLVQALNEVGIEPDALKRYPHAFSGGQRQRIAIARALMLAPDLLVCDEAVSALDAISRRQVLELLRGLQAARRLSLLFITHDPGVAAELAQRCAVMFEGRVIEAGATAELLAQPRHSHTRALVAAWRSLQANGIGRPTATLPA